MGRFKADEAENYGGTGGGGFFSLKDDGDVAKVRFMYNSYDDVEGYACHEVEVDDKKRYVNCLRDYNEPVDKCPFCAAKQFQVAKLYIPIYDIETGDVKVWERGKKFFAKISSLCARYSDLVSHIFEIERNGKKGDKQTTYEIYEVGQDETTLEDLPELPQILGGVILDKTADEMEEYLQTGYFPNSEEPKSRRSSRDEEQPVRRRDSARRTPSSRNEAF